MGDIFDDYRPQAGPAGLPYDEVVDIVGCARPHYRDVASALSQMSGEEVSMRADRLASAFRDQGVTFDLDGEERPFPLDVMPRIFTDQEWTQVEEGVSQRVRALEAFLADIYGPARILEDQVIPRQIITSSSQFLRSAHGVSPANGVRIHVAGIDVVRDQDGEFRVLEDNVRCPSGVSYVLSNRRAMARVIPEIFSGQPIRAVADYPARLISALRAAAPIGTIDPTVVVLTPGVWNSAFFEHALLARMMGVELVEGRDLVCRGTEIFQRTTDGEVRVHVIYRRVDDDYIDPLHFEPGSVVGCPGVLNAARAGGVTIANAVGTGIADDKLVYCWVPDMIRYYLDEDPVLENVQTYRLIDDDQRAEALKRKKELVFKRVDGSGGKGLVLGPYATEPELTELESQVEMAPRSWVAQPLICLSTAPTWIGDTVAPRHIDFRPFAVNDGENVWVLPGGLTRVAMRQGGMVVNSSQGGGSKDTWVVGERGSRTRPSLIVRTPPNPGPPMDVGPSFEESGQQ